MKLQYLGGALLAAIGVIADEFHQYSEPEIKVIACKYSLSKTAYFCAKDTAKSYKCTCKTPQGLGSMLNCLYDQSNVNNVHVEDWFMEYCAVANVTVTRETLRNAYQNATKYIEDITKLPGYNATHVTYVPVEYKKKQYKLSYVSTSVRYGNEDWGLWMGSGLLGYWGLIFLLSGVYNLVNKFYFLSKNLNSHPVNLIRKHLTLVAPGKKHTKPVQFLYALGGYIPLRIQIVVVGGYVALCVAFCSAGYHYVENDTIWKGVPAQMSRYTGDRAGILSCFAFLLTFLFAGRNNFLVWFTGWEHSTFVLFHKWVSRTNFLLLLVHSISMVIQSHALGKYDSRMLTSWMRWGIVALAAAGAIMVQSLYVLRKTQYEIFLFSHILMSVFFLIGAWIHTLDFGYQNWAYAMAAIWCFDRAVRLARLAYFGVQKAKVTIVSEEVIKIVVPRNKLWKPYPGAYGYLHYLTPATFWQSHPFTIIGSDDKTITFTTKIKGGVTSMIHRQVREQPGATTMIPVLLEGPYGHQAPMHRFDTALYYTGSTGIPSSYSYIQDCFKRGIQQHSKLYWVVRNWKSLDWFYDELLELKKTDAQIVVYVTDPASEHGVRHLSSSQSSSGESTKEKSGSSIGSHDVEEEKAQPVMPPQELDFIEFRLGRPNMDELVASDIKEASGTVGVLVCGHNAMVDDVRYAVSQNLDAAGGRVEYLEELQVW